MKLANHIKAKYILGLANIAYVQDTVAAAIAALIDSSPGTLDTLNELAAALGDDPNFATTVTNAIATKAPLTGAGTSGTWTISITGNAATATTATSATSATQATKLTTPRLIGGTSFDGTADITPALVTAATKLNTARTIGGTSFDGTANITIALATTATALATPRAVNGVNFDGTAPITINAVDSTARVAKAGDTMSGDLTITKTTPTLNLNDIGTTTGAFVQYSQAGVGKGYTGVATVAGALITDAVAGDFCIRTQGGIIRMSPNSGASSKAVLYDTGIASVTNFLLGVTTFNAYNATNRTVLSINGVNDALLGFGAGGANKGYVYHNGTNMQVVNQQGGGTLQLGTNAAVSMQLDANARGVGIGPDSANGLAFDSVGRANLTLAGTEGLIGFKLAGVQKQYMYHNGTTMSFVNLASGGTMQFGTDSSNRMTLSSNSLVLESLYLSGTLKKIASGNSPTTIESGSLIRAAAGTVTLPNASAGTWFKIANYSGSSITLTVAAGTLYWVTTTGNRTLTTGHLYDVVNLDGTNWILQDKSGIF